jgi:rhodanese-related sulfurtransferase
MKRILILLVLLLFTVNISSCGQPDNPFDYLRKKIGSPEKLKKVIDSQDPKFVIVDVREKGVYNKAHIPSATNIPGGTISDIDNPPPKDKYIILYCELGIMSLEAKEKMLSDGYKYVFVWGGIKEWPFEAETSK